MPVRVRLAVVALAVGVGALAVLASAGDVVLAVLRGRFDWSFVSFVGGIAVSWLLSRPSVRRYFDPGRPSVVQ